MIRILPVIAVLLAAGCAPLTTDRVPADDGCWARPIVMPPVLDVVTRDLSADHPDVRRFREDLATHNKSAVENCPLR